LVNAQLEPLHSFVLSGGTQLAAWLHVCRTVCRRAERRVVALGEQASPHTLRYLNRLSDLLFILAREANGGEDQLWVPGKNR
jgi:cob(I)alamin adenosyltransferase